MSTATVLILLSLSFDIQFALIETILLWHQVVVCRRPTPSSASLGHIHLKLIQLQEQEQEQEKQP